jgi:uracil-DNA glycosylase
MSQLKLENSWKEKLQSEFDLIYMQNLKKFLKARLQEKAEIFPKGDHYFAAMNATKFDQVKVVILGQDPYHGPGQAHGLSFSVPEGVDIPPSLQNIFKELKEDLNLPIPRSGYLQKWAEQGVLLLNSVLTVESGKPGSHQGQGWETFTDKIVSLLNEERQNLVFVLWGAYAQKKGAIINSEKHLVLKSAHPSPLSSYRGFFGSRPFSKINEYLVSTQQSPIDWSLN